MSAAMDALTERIARLERERDHAQIRAVEARRDLADAERAIACARIELHGMTAPQRGITIPVTIGTIPVSVDPGTFPGARVNKPTESPRERRNRVKRERRAAAKKGAPK